MYDSDPLDAERLRDLVLTPDGLWTELTVVEETGSTNADLAAAARGGATDGTVLLTGYQAGGRGRLNRSWTAPPGTSIALSMLVRPRPEATARWTWLPLLAGLAVTESLRRATGVNAMLKWPNDVLVGDRKLCGILAERVEGAPAGGAAGTTPPAYVIGIGINTELTEEQLPVPWATSLALVGATTRNKTTIAATVLRAFELLYRQWQSSPDDAALAQAYVNRCATIGRQVRVVLSDDRSVTGRAEAIDADGRLVVSTADGRQTFSAGDVVHLR